LKFWVSTWNSWTSVLREGIAPTRVLADEAAVDHVVLVAHPVDEDVHVLRRQRACRKLLAELVVGDADAGSKCR
jgi:hypothetical protein